MNIKKGIVCAGGHATRLGELTRMQNKHLLGVYKWPMIYYPLKLLENAGIVDVMVITGKEHAGRLIEQLGDGHVIDREEREILSLNLTYRVQVRPGGIAQAIGLTKDFCRNHSFAAILGDNIFEKVIDLNQDSAKRAHIFLCEVEDPERFGVPTIDEDGQITKIIEKPEKADSKFAVTGLYLYNNDVFDVISGLKPSGRGELEITDINNHYLRKGDLSYSYVKGWWRDVGTHQALNEVSRMVRETGACGIRF